MNEEKIPVRDKVIGPAFPLTFPIFQTASYSIPEGERYRYGREANPTVEELERQISLYEGTEKSVCFSSGMGAISTSLFHLLEPGGVVVTTIDTFARSSRLISGFMKKWGVRATVSPPGTEALLSHITERCTVFIESISNPLLRVYDIRRITHKVHALGGILICDSTFSTPENMNAADLGADLVINSLSKFMAGHNDVIGGSASGNHEIIHGIDTLRRTLGTNMDPNTAYLTLRGLKTLNLRMKEINKNGISVARNLQTVNRISNVNYPGLINHPDYEYSKDVLKGYGGVMTFEIEGISGRQNELFSHLKVIQPANTLGNTISVISHPKTMSHRSLSEDELKLVNVSDNTFRLSVGIEDSEKIIEDLKNAISLLI